MNTVELIRPDQLSADDLALWAQWRKADPDLASPYFSPAWVKAVARVRPDVRIAVLSTSGGRKCAFLPLQRPDRLVLQPAGGPLCDYQGMIGACGPDMDMNAVLKSTGAGRYDFSNLLAKQSLFARHAREIHVSRVINLAKGHAAYTQSRKDAGSSETKRAGKRKRKLSRDLGPVRLQAKCQQSAMLEQLIKWKCDQYKRTGQTDIFTRQWALSLVRNLFEHPGDDLGAELFVLYAGEKLAALNLCLRSGPVLHCWFIAHDPALSHFSPGLVLFEEIIEYACKNGITEIDLGAGDYRFKRNLANSARPLCGGFVGTHTFSARLRALEYDLRDLIEALPLGPVSAWPGKAMRRHDLHLGLKIGS
jgi:CelD/BcsL family acetyltransferase involved in cellulose biosynthesis